MRWNRFAVYGCAVMLAVGLLGCERDPPEQRLRAQVARLEQAVQAHDLGALREVLAQDFVGHDGLDREGAVRLVQVSRLRYRDIGVSLGPVAVRMHGDRATATFTAVLTGGPGVLPEAGRAYEVTTGWRADNGEWILVSAEWVPVL